MPTHLWLCSAALLWSRRPAQGRNRGFPVPRQCRRAGTVPAWHRAGTAPGAGTALPPSTAPRGTEAERLTHTHALLRPALTCLKSKTKTKKITKQQP